MLTRMTKQGGAGLRSIHILRQSHAVEDVVDFCRDLARVGVVCGIEVMFAIL
jgi:hypothetical protein